MEMYATEGSKLAGPCLPVLAQMRVLMTVDGLFTEPVIDGAPTGSWPVPTPRCL